MAKRKLELTLPMFDAPALIPVDLPNLRPYQQKAVARLRTLSLTHQRILAVSPCASGKSVIFCAIIRTSTLPVLFVCDRMELIDQTVEHLARNNIHNVGVLRADDERENPHASVQVASIQTLLRRDPPFPPDAEILIILDECHIAATDSYATAVFQRYKNALILGFTATATRLDGRPLGALFQTLEVLATYAELLQHPEWLVAPDVYSAPLRADLSTVPIVGTDFDDVQLARVMNTGELTGQIVEHWLKRSGLHPVFKDGVRQPGQFTSGERRRTFCFAVSIDHSQAICAKFEKAGVRIAHLDGTTPESQRRAMLRDLAAGELEIVSNCNVLLKGVDIVPAKCVIHARPTKSLVLWIQSCARIFRPWEHTVPLILDHARNFDEHGAPHEDRHWSLTQRPMRIKGQAPMRLCPSCYAYVVTGQLVCTYCNVEFPPAAPGELPTETKEELELRNADPEAMKRARFEKALVVARTNGFRPGFASAKIFEYYKEWPPRAWGEYAKLEFAKDSLWQALLARREQRKEAKVAQELKEAEHIQPEAWVAPATPEIVAFREKAKQWVQIDSGDQTLVAAILDTGIPVWAGDDPNTGTEAPAVDPETGETYPEPQPEEDPWGLGGESFADYVDREVGR